MIPESGEDGSEDGEREDIFFRGRGLPGQRDGFSGDERPIQENRCPGRERFIEEGGITEYFPDGYRELLCLSILLDEDRRVIGMDEEGIERDERVALTIRGPERKRNHDTCIRGRCGCLVLGEGVSDIEESVPGFAFREE